MRDGSILNCTLGLTGERLSAWRDRLLRAEEMAQITAHLPQCQACQHHLAQFDALAHQLRSQPEIEPGNRIWNPVQLRIKQPTRERHILVRTRTLWNGAGAVFATLLIVGIFIVVLHGRSSGPIGGGTPTPSPTTITAPFTITSINLVADPTTVTGRACGSTLKVTYTATFHIAPNGPGGTIQFMHSATNGRGSTNASVSVPAGATTVPYTFTKTGTLSLDRTFPGVGYVASTSPNSLTAQTAPPSGTCH